MRGECKIIYIISLNFFCSFSFAYIKYKVIKFICVKTGFVYIYREKCAVNFQMHFDDAAAAAGEPARTYTMRARRAYKFIIYDRKNR